MRFEVVSIAPNKLFGLALGLLMAVLVAGVIHAAPGDPVPGLGFFLNPSNTFARGVIWDGTHFWISSGASVYGYEEDGDAASPSRFTINFDSSRSSGTNGITWDGTHFWVGFNRRSENHQPRGLEAYDTVGALVAGSTFSLYADNDHGYRIEWDGTYFRVLDSTDDKVYSYTAQGTYTSSADFDLATGNDDPAGIVWDDTYFRVVDSDDDKVYSYTAEGTYTSSADFALATGNDDPAGIGWDGTYFRVVDDSDDYVYVYEGITPVDEAVEFNSLLVSNAATHDGWICIKSQSGRTVTVNNAQVTIHGFCAKEFQGAGAEVEIHVAPATTYAELDRIADLTGFWRFAETANATSTWIYNDTPTTETNRLEEIEEGSLAFVEAPGGLESSTRLGFATMSKTVADENCVEEQDTSHSDDSDTDGRGFTCNQTNLSDLGTGESAVFQYAFADANNIEFADQPRTPESLTVSRNTDYTTATIRWTLYDAVTEYEVQRTTAVQVDVADASRIEYGDPVTYMISGTQAGIDEYVDTSLQAHRTYQYRVRARGADAASWSAWSDYVFSGAEPEVDLPAPGNLELHRNSSSVTASWSAPIGDFDNFTLQRQELILVGGSTFFGNVSSLGDDMWLPMDSTMFEDTSILPGQTYEYRVAAVLDDQVGVYTDWFRVGPVNASLGPPPTNFRPLQTPVVTRGFVERVFDERYEFWLGWNAVGRASDYQVQFVSFDLATGGRSLANEYVTQPYFFHTTYSRVALRVRARGEVDADRCADNDDDRCVTEWTAWVNVGFTPVVTIDAPSTADDSMDYQHYGAARRP